jgi:arylsulfatase A-like enzyme
MQENTTANKKNSLFSYLLVLTVFFLMLELSFFIQGSGLYLGDFKLVAHHLQVPSTILPGILLYVGAQLLVHFLYVVFIWGVMTGAAIAMPKLRNNIEIYGMGLWFLGLLTLLLANQHYFPNSKFAYLTKNIFHVTLGNYLFWIFLTAFTSVLVLAFVGLFLLSLRRIRLTLSLLGVGLLASVGFASHHNIPIVDVATADKPNIIIIGVDSLRPDFLGYMGGTKRTPHIDALLENSTVFTEAMTPLARTFPAWVSILTGEYPKKTNVRFNLQTDINFDLAETLPAILQRQGYETIFSTDETRFSNIDQKFGFDRVITPPIGFNDFLVGTLNDFPMSNLLVNSKVGHYLFPYSYGNRPVFTTYDPNSFLNLLKANLAEPRKKPLFLVTHFCLPHYPYFWGKKPAYTLSIHNYQAAVKRVDQQLNDFLTILKNDKLLEHSVVILLSDHGEAIELRGDRATDADFFVPGKANVKKVIPHFYPKALDSEHVNQSAGHGTDVLSITQYHTVLAFQFYGLPGQVPGVIPGRVSLLDIKPTILSIAGVRAPKLSGNSLTDYLAGKKAQVSAQNDFFTESDFSPQAVRSVHPETRKVLFEGIDFFEINQKTARLSVKKSMADLIISSKQFADFNGPWVLALYPQKNQTMTPVLVNLETGYWTNDLGTSLAKQAPVNHMLAAMKDFFGSDIKKVVSG